MNLAIKEKDKQIVAIVIFAILIVIDLAMILGWQYRIFSKYQQTLSGKKKVASSLESEMKNLDKTKKEASELESKIESLRFSIVEEKNISALIENISNLANNSGFKITQIKPETDNANFQTVEAKDIKLREIEIQIVGKSDFHQLGNFMSKIESDKNFYKVASLDIDSDGKDYSVQNIRLSLRTFVNVI